MPMTNAQKAKMLDHYYGATELVRPAKLYIGLSTTKPTATGGNFTEPGVENGYERVEVDNNANTWENATIVDPSVKKNKIPIEFPEAAANLDIDVQATGNWGEVKYWGIFEQATGGTCVDWAELSIHKVISSGDAARFKAGELRTSISNPKEED